MTPVLPDAALAQHVAIIGKTGSGKSWCARGIVEHLLGARRRVCILDYTGVWWGLRSNAAGTGTGYPVVIFGGEHADVPLGEGIAPAVARFVAEGAHPTIIDVDGLTVGAQQRFVTSFCEELYRLNAAPLHLVIEEVDEFAPQTGAPGAERMIGAVCRLFQRGRSKGFRCIAITQRLANVHKRVVAQCNAMLALRLVSPQDRKAFAEWVRGHGDEERGAEVIASLARLARGEGWVWVPEQDILRRVAFPGIKTYDSMRAPEEDAPSGPKVWAEIDRSALRAQFETAEKEADANDPKLLRRRIADLERQMRDSVVAKLDPEAIERARQEGVIEGDVAGYRRAHAEFARVVGEACSAFDTLRKWTTDPPFVPEPPTRAASPVASRGNGAGDPMPGPQRKLLTVLAQYPGGRTKKQLAILAGYSHQGGAFNNPLGNLRSRGWVVGGPACIEITDDGLKALGNGWEPLPMGADLREYWYANLPGPAAKLLRALCEAYPKGLSKADLAAATGYEPTGGAFNNPLGRLRALELATGRGGADIRASDELFA